MKQRNVFFDKQATIESFHKKLWCEFQNSFTKFLLSLNYVLLRALTSFPLKTF